MSGLLNVPSFCERRSCFLHVPHCNITNDQQHGHSRTYDQYPNFPTHVRLAFGSHSWAPRPNHNFHKVQSGSIHGLCVSFEEPARKYLRRAYRSTLRPIITVCVGKEENRIYTYLSTRLNIMTVASCLCFYCSSSWLYGRQIGSAKISALTPIQAQESYSQLASSRTRPYTCPIAKQDI